MSKSTRRPNPNPRVKPSTPPKLEMVSEAEAESAERYLEELRSIEEPNKELTWFERMEKDRVPNTEPVPDCLRISQERLDSLDDPIVKEKY